MASVGVQDKEACLRVCEEREADVRRALQVKDEQLLNALATLQVKEDQVRGPIMWVGPWPLLNPEDVGGMF